MFPHPGARGYGHYLRRFGIGRLVLLRALTTSIKVRDLTRSARGKLSDRSGIANDSREFNSADLQARLELPLSGQQDFGFTTSTYE